jgi:protoheme IX farnesyltransferase
LVLFGILFCWQIPHFLAIAWIYREEYQAAGFVMLKADDFSGVVTAITALSFSIILGIVSCVPIWFGRAGVAYGWAVGFLGLLLVGYSVVFLIERTRVSAKRLFLTSIVYLPALLVAVVLAWRA